MGRRQPAGAGRSVRLPVAGDLPRLAGGARGPAAEVTAGGVSRRAAGPWGCPNGPGAGLYCRPCFAWRARTRSHGLSTDVLIVGGGIAGVWLNARLRRAGFATLLVEKGSLGGGQSVKSQGIIHGGTKYALHGALTGSSEAIAAMPGRWREALAG